MGDSQVSLRFLVDEDVPRSTARVLRDAGFDAVDVRDVGLRGKSDQLVFDYAQRENRLLISCDLGFSNIVNFPPSMSRGLVVVRIPDSETIETFNQEVLKAVKEVGEGLRQHLAIVEISKVRLRGG
jgi:predicted nuclease of predicted toxin-antitoxin system